MYLSSKVYCWPRFASGSFEWMYCLTCFWAVFNKEAGRICLSMIMRGRLCEFEMSCIVSGKENEIVSIMMAEMMANFVFDMFGVVESEAAVVALQMRPMIRPSAAPMNMNGGINKTASPAVEDGDPILFSMVMEKMISSAPPSDQMNVLMSM